jgi:hypothetical protein
MTVVAGVRRSFNNDMIWQNCSKTIQSAGGGRRHLRRIVFVTLLASIAAVGSGLADESGPTADLSCVKSLDLPTHGIIASGSPESGVVTAEIQVGEKGDLADLRLSGGNQLLQGEVRVAIQLSTFAAQCKGRVLKFLFSFTLQEPATDSILPPAVQYLPPNRFELTFRRRKPTYDPGSPPSKESRQPKK